MTSWSDERLCGAVTTGGSGEQVGGEVATDVSDLFGHVSFRQIIFVLAVW